MCELDGKDWGEGGRKGWERSEERRMVLMSPPLSFLGTIGTLILTLGLPNEEAGVPNQEIL